MAVRSKLHWLADKAFRSMQITDSLGRLSYMSLGSVSQILIEPISEDLDVFGGAPEVPPTVALAWPDDQLDADRINFLGLLREAFGLLQRDDGVGIAVDDHRGGE